MGRTGKPSAPWTVRALARQLPAADYSGHIATTRETALALSRSDVRITPRTYTVADLQRAARREARVK